MVGNLTIRALKLSLIISFMTGGVLALGGSPASATFIIDPDPGGDHLDIDKANKDASSFAGHVDGFLVTVDTVGLVDTGGGYANIKPIKDGTLNDLLFTPFSSTYFAAFSFRGQLSDGGNVTVNVKDPNEALAQSFIFTPSATGDFARIGILGTLGETIEWVQIIGGFKEFKQVDFNLAEGISPVPEPTMLPLFATGLGMLGWFGWKRRRQQLA